MIRLRLLFLPLLRAPERATKQQLEDSLGTVLRRAFRSVADKMPDAETRAEALRISAE